MHSHSPALSVVIPVFNGGSTLSACLDALYASTFSDFDVIVVDDGSSDDSAAIASRFPCRLISLERNIGPAAARNIAAAATGAPFLLFLDADVLVPPAFIGDALARLHANPGLSALFCSYTRHTIPSDVYSRYKNLIHHWTHQQSAADAVTFCGGFGLVRRDVFVAAGGFDAALRYLEDIDLGYRLHLAGHRIALVKDLQATHAKAYTLFRLLRSELFGRAIPWTRLLLKYRVFRNDLNTRGHNVASVSIACALPFAAVKEFRIAAVLFVTLLWLNRRFLRFAASEYGIRFALASVLLTWITYFTSGLGVVAGVISAAWAVVARRHGTSAANPSLCGSPGSRKPLNHPASEQ
jgi:GT2 family glycosyltransferase